MKQIKKDMASREFKRCYLLYGEEDYLKNQYRDSMKKAVLNEGDEMNASIFKGKITDLSEARGIANTMPFFADYRILIFEDSGLLKSANDFTDFIDEFPDTTVLLFVEQDVDKRNRLYKYISKNGYVCEMNKMEASDMKLWVATVLQKDGKVIREKTIEYLLSNVEDSMINVMNELDKLVAFSGDRQEITIEDIDQICSKKDQGDIFKMIEAVASRNKSLVMNHYKELVETVSSPLVILTLLHKHIFKLLIVKSLGNASRGEIAKAAGVPPFAVGKYQKQASYFTMTSLKDMLSQCEDTDYGIKIGKVSDIMGVELLLIAFSSM